VFSPDGSGILFGFRKKFLDLHGMTKPKRYSGQQENAPKKQTKSWSGFCNRYKSKEFVQDKKLRHNNLHID